MADAETPRRGRPRKEPFEARRMKCFRLSAQTETNLIILGAMSGRTHQEMVESALEAYFKEHQDAIDRWPDELTRAADDPRITRAQAAIYATLSEPDA